MVVFPIGENNNGDGTSDLSPSTVTVIQILSDASTSTPSHSTTNSQTSIPLKTTITVTTRKINSSLSRISTSTPTSSSKSLVLSSPSSSTLSPSTSSGAPLSEQNSKTLSTSSLNSGAIAGIVIACVFVFLVGAVFAFRTWSKKKRASKLSKIWPRSVVSKPYGIDAPESSYEAKLASGNGNSRGLPLSVQIPSPHVSVPPISYNNDPVFQHSTTPVTSSPPVFTSPVYSPGLMSLSPYSTTVVCTFIPSLPDELTIFVGERLRVLAGYEDGWSLCMNIQGKQGMVPNECLEKSFSSMELLPPPPIGDYRISRSSARVSSLAQAVRHGR